MIHSYEWTLVLEDGTEQSVQPLSRPTLELEELEQPDGSCVVGAMTWLPLPCSKLDGWEGKQDIILRLHNRTQLIEEWLLRQARSGLTSILFESALHK